MTRIPTNHRQAERVLIERVRVGLWQIDKHGSIWTIGYMVDGRIYPGCRRRVDRLMPSGYRLVQGWSRGKCTVGLAHRLVWQLAHGNIPDGAVINHKNGVKHDNRLSNLEVVSYSENRKHAHRTGLIDQWGQRNPAAKLSDKQVAEIKRRRLAGELPHALAKEFGVSRSYVWGVVKGIWRNRRAE